MHKSGPLPAWWRAECSSTTQQQRCWLGPYLSLNNTSMAFSALFLPSSAALALKADSLLLHSTGIGHHRSSLKYGAGHARAG